MKKAAIIILAVLLLVPVVSMAQENCTPTYSGPKLCNALPQFGGQAITDIPSLAAAVFSWLATVIGTLALVMIIFGGAQMIFSRGDSAAVTSAKATITYAIYGFVLVMFAYVIVSGVQYFFGFDQGLQPGQAENDFFQNPVGTTNARTFVENTIVRALSLLGIAAMFYIILSGFRYVNSRGNEDEAKKAKQGLTWAIMGFISILLSYGIVTIVINTVQNAAQ